MTEPFAATSSSAKATHHSKWKPLPNRLEMWYGEKLAEKPSHVVGLENAQWVAMDYSDILVHIFLPEVRAYYNLENLWEDATLEHIPDLD